MYQSFNMGSNDPAFEDFKQKYISCVNEQKSVLMRQNIPSQVMVEICNAFDANFRTIFDDFISKIRNAPSIKLSEMQQHVASAFKYIYDRLMTQYNRSNYFSQPNTFNNFNQISQNTYFSSPTTSFQNVSQPQTSNPYDMGTYTTVTPTQQNYVSQEPIKPKQSVELETPKVEHEYKPGNIKTFSKEETDKLSIDNLSNVSKVYSFTDPITDDTVTFVIMEVLFPINDRSELLRYFDKYFNTVKKNYVYLIRYNQMKYLDAPYGDMKNILENMRKIYLKDGSLAVLTYLDEVPNKYVKVLEKLYCTLANNLLTKYCVKDTTLDYVIQIEHFSDVKDILNKDLPSSLNNITTLPNFYERVEDLIDKVFDLLLSKSYTETNSSILDPEKYINDICAFDEVCFIYEKHTKRDFYKIIKENPEAINTIRSFTVLTYINTILITDVFPDQFVLKSNKTILPNKACNVLEETILHCNSDVGLMNEDICLIIKDNKKLNGSLLEYSIGKTLQNRSFIEIK